MSSDGQGACGNRQACKYTKIALRNVQSGIRDTAESIGLRTASAKLARLRLRKVVPLPRIAHWYQRHFIVRMAGPCFRPGTGPAETLRTGLPERPALRHGSIDQTKNVAVLKSSFEIFSYPKRISPGQTAVYTS